MDACPGCPPPPATGLQPQPHWAGGPLTSDPNLLSHATICTAPDPRGGPRLSRANPPFSPACPHPGQGPCSAHTGLPSTGVTGVADTGTCLTACTAPSSFTLWALPQPCGGGGGGSGGDRGTDVGPGFLRQGCRTTAGPDPGLRTLSPGPFSQPPRLEWVELCPPNSYVEGLAPAPLNVKYLGVGVFGEGVKLNQVGRVGPGLIRLVSL